MFDPKKRNFWRLALFFSALVIITLVILWQAPGEPVASMMPDSMGNMLKQMHLNNITIYDLFKSDAMQAQMQAMPGHQPGQLRFSLQLSALTTTTIFLLLPFIIGGAVILGIVWIK
jgi:hypothetical protein